MNFKLVDTKIYEEIRNNYNALKLLTEEFVNTCNCGFSSVCEMEEVSSNYYNRYDEYLRRINILEEVQNKYYTFNIYDLSSVLVSLINYYSDNSINNVFKVIYYSDEREYYVKRYYDYVILPDTYDYQSKLYRDACINHEESLVIFTSIYGDVRSFNLLNVCMSYSKSKYWYIEEFLNSLILYRVNNSLEDINLDILNNFYKEYVNVRN